MEIQNSSRKTSPIGGILMIGGAVMILAGLVGPMLKILPDQLMLPSVFVGVILEIVGINIALMTGK